MSNTNGLTLTASYIHDWAAGNPSGQGETVVEMIGVGDYGWTYNDISATEDRRRYVCAFTIAYDAVIRRTSPMSVGLKKYSVRATWPNANDTCVADGAAQLVL